MGFCSNQGMVNAAKEGSYNVSKMKFVVAEIKNHYRIKDINETYCIKHVRAISSQNISGSVV